MIRFFRDGAKLSNSRASALPGRLLISHGKASIRELAKAGEGLLKPELRAGEWERYVGGCLMSDIKGVSSREITEEAERRIRVAIDVMKALEKGKPLKEVGRIMNNLSSTTLTNLEQEKVTMMVSYFHKRGEDFKGYFGYGGELRKQ